MASLVEVVPTSIGKLELPLELIGQVLGFLDGRSLSSFEITCVLMRQYIRDNPCHFKHLLVSGHSVRWSISFIHFWIVMSVRVEL